MEATKLISYIIALALPAMALYLIFALDLFGTGKFSTVLSSFVWGAVGAYLLSKALNNYVFLAIFPRETVVTLTAPMTEEICKALVLVYLVQRPRFRYIVDGAVYGFAVGIGYSVAENIFTYMAISRDPLVGTISRILSATLMHATASALVGIALGRLRRSRSKFQWSLVGIGAAITLHVIYNNAVTSFSGVTLLLIAIGSGAVGVVLIFFLINQGLKEEKQSFGKTLSASVGVSRQETKMLQGMGGSVFEEKLKEFADSFGMEKANIARRMLVIQANSGILKNNLASPASDRLREAWQKEFDDLRVEFNRLQRQLGAYRMSYLRSIFPEKDEGWTEAFATELSKAEPNQVHSFDVFMRASEVAGTISSDQLERTAGMLQRADMFRDVTLSDLENLSRAVTSRTFQADELIFSEGESGDTMFMIKHGAIDLFKRDKGGRDKLLRTCNPGDVVGELALIDGYPRSAGARAKGQVVALQLRREHFLMFIQSRPQVILAVLRFMANRVRSTSEALAARTDWAKTIVEGDYKTAQALGMMIPQAGVAHETSDDPTTGKGPASGSIQTVSFLGGAFSKVAGALEKREQTIVEDSKDADKRHLIEISELPDHQKRVVNAILRDPIGTSRGLTRDILRSKLEDVTNLSEILEELDKEGWLVISTDQNETRYKVNLQRRRGRNLDGLKAWTKLDKDIN